MKAQSIAPLLALAAPALAAPSFRIPSTSDLAVSAFESAQSWLHGALSSAKHEWDAIDTGVHGALMVENVAMHGIEYMALSHPAFPLHKLRIVEPTLCDPGVFQISGYLDISETKHLFFWFEESRHKPETDPLVLWYVHCAIVDVDGLTAGSTVRQNMARSLLSVLISGGPGCSSTTGHLFELGGCNIADEGKNVTYNEYSWNNVANVLFLDQPINVGYSYSDAVGEEVNNSPLAAEDVYAFLILFISQFKKYSKQEFHVAGESYAGTYIPNIANVIQKNNLALQVAPNGLPQLNFASVLIGDGLTDPYAQFGSVPDWACDGPYAVYDDPEGPECTKLRGKVPRCQQLIQACYNSGSRFACVPAALYCWSGIFGDLQELGLNLYDVRRTCDKSPDKDGQLCYREMQWMETYLNQPSIKKELGVPDQVTFASCNMKINQNFLFQGDGMHYAGGLLTDLVEDGIRVLIYAGEADMIVNYMGCAQVLDRLETSYLEEYTNANLTHFKSSNGTVAGWTKSAGKGAGNVAFVSFHNAGHMVPHDDPPAALTMFDKWLKNKPLA
ncbi:hypothetical protein Q5752_004316 [Cryptotrichosporon argae]